VETKGGIGVRARSHSPLGGERADHDACARAATLSAGADDADRTASMLAASPRTEEEQQVDTRRRRSVAVVARGAAWVALAWVTINLVILLVGFFLKLFGANVEAGFTEFWYRHLDRVMEPFRAIFPSAELGTTAADVPAVLDTSILFAMVVYTIVYLAIHALLDWLSLRIARADAMLLDEAAPSHVQASA
jgi:hypothetical protein